MIHFRTILLWLAFLLLIAQNIIEIKTSFLFGFIFRMIPSAILLFWFILAIYFKENLKLNVHETPKLVFKLINILRPLANLSIVLGALFKIMHLPFGNLLLITGIGFMAIYSSILSRYSRNKPDNNSDIIDDIDE